MKLFQLFLITFCINSYAQLDFQDHNISAITDGAISAYAADLDGDGDMDVISASYRDDTVAWYENTDGLGSFGPQLIISANADGARSVYAADIDGDGDMDVLSASSFDNKVAWYENNGAGSFGSEQIITLNAANVKAVFFSDIDNDGDIDVLSASLDDNKIAWYENTDGQGSFGPQLIITTDALAAITVYAADIDGDDDMDVLSASRSDNKIAWYENTDGLGTFGPQLIINTTTTEVRSVYAIDLDGDNDVDVLSASLGDDKIAWYENTDGQGSFGPQQVITTNADGAYGVSATDLDMDGDMDVLSASEYDDKIAWYENTDGQGSFDAQQIITTNTDGAQTIYAADIDGDGDMDLLSTSWLGNKVDWHENLSSLSINDTALLDFSVYPIPTTGDLTIKSKTRIAVIELYNTVGQLVLANSLQNKIDISSLSPGLYFIRIKAENGIFGTKKVVKK
ncbi:MAG: T9SS type A sorting domain-containing protein [Aequorivita sp.]|nr:T9SS type A sorting domain-containing protein [Aequorivita sp.]